MGASHWLSCGGMWKVEAAFFLLGGQVAETVHPSLPMGAEIYED